MSQSDDRADEAGKVVGDTERRSREKKQGEEAGGRRRGKKQGEEAGRRSREKKQGSRHIDSTAAEAGSIVNERE